MGIYIYTSYCPRGWAMGGMGGMDIWEVPPTPLSKKKKILEKKVTFIKPNTCNAKQANRK